MKQVKPKRERPETLREAQSWETYKNQHLQAGLCYRCACQAAYGRQLGFSRVASPCEDCRALACQENDLGLGVPTRQWLTWSETESKNVQKAAA